MNISQNIDKKRINNDVRNVRRKIRRLRNKQFNYEIMYHRLEDILHEIDSLAQNEFQSVCRKNMSNQQTTLQFEKDIDYVVKRYNSLFDEVASLCKYLQKVEKYNKKMTDILNDSLENKRFELTEAFNRMYDNLNAFYKCLDEF